MRRLTFIIAAFASLACGPAGAVDFDSAIGKTGIGRCHMDVCSFFQIQTSEPIAVLKDGTLFAISELSWTAEYKQYGDDDDHEYDRAPVSVGAKKPDAYVVFCSKTRPYAFFDNEGKWDVLALRPGDDSAVFGYTEAAYASYWAACHHFITQDAISAKMAQKLGYHFTGGFPENAPEDKIKSPQDLLKWRRSCLPA